MEARTEAFCINPGLQKQIKYKGIFICCRTTDPMIDASRHSQRSPGGSSRARLHRDAMDTQRRLGRNNLGQCKYSPYRIYSHKGAGMPARPCKLERQSCPRTHTRKLI